MSYSYERIDTQRRRQAYGASSRRSTLGYWVPLAVTVTAATLGLAAWIWKERRDEEQFEYDRREERRDERRDDRKGSRPPPEYGESPYPPETQPIPPDDPGLIERMQGALRRTPSPQQFLDQAGRRVSAGVAAAGAAVTGAVGSALSSIREEDKAAYEDHTRWSEEAAVRAVGSASFSSAPLQVPASMKSDRRKTVAIVVSAEGSRHGTGAEEPAPFQEHASILSHLPEHIGDDCRVFVMIYAPDLRQHPLGGQATQPDMSLSSSYSNIGNEEIHGQTTGLQGEADVERPFHSDLPMFDAMYAQGKALVEKPTMIMPFTTPGGYVHLLRHIAPEVVYVQITLAGEQGDAVKHIAGWVGQVVLVVGDESGHGGLVDSEDEHGGAGNRGARWWQEDPRIGLGKGIEVVEGMRVGEDWRRRVRGHD